MVRQISGLAGRIYEEIRDAPIVSPHGHCDPAWFAQNNAFSDPAELLVIPDHYVFRMLHSQGIALRDLGIGVAPQERDPRAIFRRFASNWHLFLGTPSHIWISDVLEKTIGCSADLNADTADDIYAQIADWLTDPAHRPRALFERFQIEVLATTDGALDPLDDHKAVHSSDWSGRIVPTFRPDAVLDPMMPEWADCIARLAQITGHDTQEFDGYLAALQTRRQVFRAMGATATDHAIEHPATCWLDAPEKIYAQLLTGDMTHAAAFHGHMLVEMAQMSVEDGLVMQLHAGSRRDTNRAVLDAFGRDKGADIPIAVDWVRGLEPLLNRVGNDPRLTLILFTLDENTYARELAPMAGHWPCLRIGPPWWFHDSPAGIARYFNQVVETAGYHNLAGFNDDTRAFLSIPARHDMWRRCVAIHLAEQIGRGYFSAATATELAHHLAHGLARSTYRLG